MKSIKYRSVGTVTKSNRKIIERGKIDTHIYMIANFPGLDCNNSDII